MKYKFFLILLFVCLGKLNAQNIFENLDVFDLQYVRDPQISPDGSLIVYVRTEMDIMKDGRSSTLWTINSDGTNHQKLTSNNFNESNPRWSPDGKRISFISNSDDGNGSEIYIYWTDSRQYSSISQLDGSPRSLKWSRDGRYLAFIMFVPEKTLQLVSPPRKPKNAKWADKPRITERVKHEADGSGYMREGFSQLFYISSDGGKPKQVTSEKYNHYSYDWMSDSDGFVFSSNYTEDWEYDFRNSEIYSISIDGSNLNTLTDRNGPDRGAVVSPDGKLIAYLGYNDKVQTYQISKLSVMNIDGTSKREIEIGLDRSISSLTWSRDGKSLYFMYDDEGNTKVAISSLSGETKTLFGDVGGTTIGRPYGGGSYSISKNGKISYTITSPYHPADIAIYDGKSSDRLTHLNKDLFNGKDLGTIEEIWYNSTVDGRRIQGWIAKPPGFISNKKYPLIVENHGGPISNYGDRFSPEILLYSAAGYVVFYPNPRGSTSYGEEFGNLLYRNYPGDDYHDVMDGVDKVLDQGYVDKDNLFVTGGSAGGIMTAWIIGKTNRFKASAVIKPVMNWISKTLVADNYFGYAHTRYEGQPWENFNHYWSFSPISLVGNIETPTMVMVGLNDLRTPPSESKQLYHALKLRKIETVYVEIPGAYHNISNKPSQLITKIDHILYWFNKYRD
ncbi:MAG: peptidase S9 family protein [Flammeovirgaceae bacterium]|nr:peptidase S9 family protein [Flammeovirgaceae bacterium]MAS39259.1 peptidase S9 family protein [Flammeovirgaceae bacterium]|tara:strand:+ start:6772 stop:8790 length:2019 start_codon:yes stop_codon:yes gene_type:complete